MQVFSFKCRLVRMMYIVFSTVIMLYLRFNILTRSMCLRVQGVRYTWCTRDYTEMV